MQWIKRFYGYSLQKIGGCRKSRLCCVNVYWLSDVCLVKDNTASTRASLSKGYLKTLDEVSRLQSEYLGWMQARTVSGEKPDHGIKLDKR